MNGIGNEIAVLDLRGIGLTVSGRRSARDRRGEGLAYDQLMVLHEPRSAGADAFMTIFNSDGSQAEACGNGTRCVAFILMRGTPREKLVLETAAGRLACWRRAETGFHRRYGPPALCLERNPARAILSTIRATSNCRSDRSMRPFLHTPSAVNMGNPHAIFWVDDIEAYDLGRIGPLLENHPIFPERANISLAHVASRDAHRAKSLGARHGLDPRLRLGRLCRARCGGAQGPHRPQAPSSACPAAISTSNGGRATAMSLMTGPVEFEFETRLDPEPLQGYRGVTPAGA